MDVISGLIGGAIGALSTGTAFGVAWLTMRHQRELARQARAQDRLQVSYTGVLRGLHQIEQVCDLLTYGLEHENPREKELLELLERENQEAENVIGQGGTDMRVFGSPEVRELARAAGLRFAEWCREIERRPREEELNPGGLREHVRRVRQRLEQFRAAISLLEDRMKQELGDR